LAASNRYSQDKTASTRYRMQFILGPRVPAGFEDWQQIKTKGGLYLTAHPHLNVEQASGASVSITLIGYLLDPRTPHAGNIDIVDKLIVAMEQGEDLFELVYPLGGRWLLLVNDSQGTRLAASGLFRQTADSRELVRLTTGAHCNLARTGHGP